MVVAERLYRHINTLAVNCGDLQAAETLRRDRMKKHIFGALIALSCLFLLASPLQAQQSRLDSIKADGVLRVEHLEIGSQ